ncbi:hypothetical protein CerSpe_271020 [Prunus speciosa]
MGLACHIAKIHSEASVEHNGSELKQYIEELYWGSGKRVKPLGHSKGGVDAAAALSIYWPVLSRDHKPRTMPSDSTGSHSSPTCYQVNQRQKYPIYLHFPGAQGHGVRHWIAPQQTGLLFVDAPP